MVDAASPFLNQPLRSETQARRDIAEHLEGERRRRLEHHGAGFVRTILDHAFTRIYQPDGSYRLQPVQRDEAPPPTEDCAPADAVQGAKLARSPCAEASAPRAETIVRHAGYCAALRDIARWVATVALRPRMDPDTLRALNLEIQRLSRTNEANEAEPVATES